MSIVSRVDGGRVLADQSRIIPKKKVCSRSGSMQEVTSRLSPPSERIEKLVRENPVMVFGAGSCFMCHVVKRLMQSLGVNPIMHDLEAEPGRTEMENALAKMAGKDQALPAVFVGGELIGSLDNLMAAHISGILVPRLKEAGVMVWERKALLPILGARGEQTTILSVCSHAETSAPSA